MDGQYQKRRGIEMKKIVLTTAFVSTLALGACSTTGGLPDESYGVPHFIKASGKTPSWVDSPGLYTKEHKDRHYFIGMSSRCTPYDMCRIEADARAREQATIDIQSKIHSLVEVAATDDSALASPDVQKAIEAGTLQVASATLHGLMSDRYFWKKYYVTPSPGSPVFVYRNVVVLASMSNDEYKRSVYETLTRTASKVNNPDAKALLKKMEGLWLNDKGGN